MTDINNRVTVQNKLMIDSKLIANITCNAVSAVKKWQCWFLSAWIQCTVEFLVDSGAVVPAISYELYELLHSNVGWVLENNGRSHSFAAENILSKCTVHVRF
jgi:hypothetical protein